MTAHVTTVTVRDWGCGRADGSLPYRGFEFIGAIQKAFAEIPPEHRGTALFDLDGHDDYGVGVGTLTLTYERPESDDEKEDRIIRERIHWVEQRDKAADRFAYCDAQLKSLEMDE